MIQITVQEAARKRKIPNANALGTRLGFSPAVAADLWNPNGALPRLQTLDKICEAWKCPLTELVRWVPDKKRSKG